MVTRETLLLNNRFQIFLGKWTYSFSRVSNISSSIDVETVNEGGVNGYPRLLYRQKRQADVLVLEKGVAMGDNLLAKGAAKVTGVLGGELKLGTIIKGGIILVKNGLLPSKTYVFDEGIVVKWEAGALDALGKDILIEKLEIRHSGLEEFSIF